MKKRMLFIAITLLLVVPAFTGCGGGGGGFNRSEVAKTVVAELGFTGSDKSAIDITGNKNKADIEACISRSVFGRAGQSYKFRPSEKLTNYELAKLSICAYAALLCLEDHQIAPGSPRTVKDIGNMEVEQQWFIYAALENGFVSLDKDNNFKPNDAASKSALNDTLAKIKTKAGALGTDIATYRAKVLANFEPSPKPDVPLAEYLTVFDARNVHNQALSIVLSSLQGLVNRDKIQLYLNYSSYHFNYLNGHSYAPFDNGYMFYTDYAIEKEYFKGYAQGMPANGVEGFDNLLQMYKQYIGKAVVYEFGDDSRAPARHYTQNVAIDIAAVEGRIVMHRDFIDTYKAIVPDADIKYVSDLNLKSQFEAQTWSYKNCFQFLRRDAIAFTNYSPASAWMRDYVVQMKLPTVWVPGSASDDYDLRTMPAVSTMLHRMPANIVAFGTQSSYDGIIEHGLGEVLGVNFTSEHSKFTAPYDSVGNQSWHNALPVAPENMKFNNTIRDIPEVKTFDPSKKYFAVTMAESGDAPCYVQYGMPYFQWFQEGRDTVPYSYAYSITNWSFNPLFTQYLVENQTPNTYFYSAVAGLGYIYPMGGYGVKGGITVDDGVYMDPDEVMADHFTKLNEMCKRMGYRGFHIYMGTPGTLWQDRQFREVEDRISKYLPDLDYIAADIHRQKLTPYSTGEELKVLRDGTRMYLCVTNFYHNLPFFNHENEEASIDKLYEEIRDNTRNGSNFYTGMAYSWQYGSRRVGRVYDRLNANYPGEYVFVTLGELDALVAAYLAS